MLSLYFAVIEDFRDKNKFEELYYKHRGMMFATARGILKSDTLAEDAVQEALFSIAKNICKIDVDNEKMLASYLYITTKNAAYKIYREETKHCIIDIDILHDISVQYNVTEMLEWDEKYREIVSYILSLPESYREILSMYYMYGFNSREISEILNISINTVKSCLRRGKKQLSIKLKEIDKNDE